MSAASNPRNAEPDPRRGISVAAHGVSKVFGRTKVLDDVSISIPVGDSRALVGRNGAGKSTLVGILTGMLAPTKGTVTFNGEPAPSAGDRQAWRERVACVYQRWTVIPHLTVAENLFLNNEPRGLCGVIRWGDVRDRTRSVLRDWGLDVDPDLEAARLTVEQRQIVEIGRALLQGSRFIILDEPTAELERREVTRLFDRIRALQDDGVTFVYISHHLEEIYEICRTVTVLRDGKVVADAGLSDLSRDGLVRAMVGGAGTPAKRQPLGSTAATVSPALEIEGLSVGEVVRDVSIRVGRGECVGLAGLAGSGKDEIAEVAAGLRRPDAGRILVEGVPFAASTPVAARRRGIGYVPRDRHIRGNLPQLSLRENLTVTVMDTLGRAGFVNPARQAERATDLMKRLGIVASSVEQPVGQLSGGNQQKGLMGRALASEPRVLVLVAPAQGVDVASKDALFATIQEACTRGMGVLLVSDELDELSICVRVEVIFRGSITATFGPDRDEHRLVAAIEGLVLKD